MTNCPPRRRAHLMKSRVRHVQAFAALAFTVACLCLPLLSRGQMSAPAPYTPTPWRTGKPFEEAGYVGREACAKCHEQESASQHTTAMGRAIAAVADSPVDVAPPRSRFRAGPDLLQIMRPGGAQRQELAARTPHARRQLRVVSRAGARSRRGDAGARPQRQTHLQSGQDESRRTVAGVLRLVPPQRRAGALEQDATGSAQRPLPALPSVHEPRPRTLRPAHELHGLPRPARQPATERVLLRLEVLRLPPLAGEPEVAAGGEAGGGGRAQREALPRRTEGLRLVPHAEGRAARLALQVHRPPHTHRPTGRAVPELRK